MRCALNYHARTCIRSPFVSRQTITSGSHGTVRHHASGSAQSPNAVVLSKRVPDDFIRETLKPHLEAQILDSIHIYVPGELVKITQAYSKIVDKSPNLCQKLVDTIKFRMSSFEHMDIVGCLSPVYTINPDDDELYDVMAERIEQLLDEFNALNLVAITRIYNKRRTKNFKLVAKVLPLLKGLLGKYDDAELCEMLLSIGASGDGVKDMDILLVIIPEIEKRYDTMPLVEHLNNLWALSKLKIIHRTYLQRVAKDIANPRIGSDLTAKYLCRIAWIYRRCGCFDLVDDLLRPLIHDSKDDFSVSDFARLAQSMPPSDNSVLIDVQATLRRQIPEMGRQELIFLMNGSIHIGNLEVKQASGSLLEECMNVIRVEQDNFRPKEIEHIAVMLRTSDKYCHLLDELPQSWYESVKHVLKTYDF